MIAHASWHVATVSAIDPETPNAHRITLEIPTWPGNVAGQHLDVRLTAPDGYQASRSYSIASVGADTAVELAVDRVPTGEVSPFLVDELMVGDQLEVRGPLGGWFVWEPPDASTKGPSQAPSSTAPSLQQPVRPVQLIGGGSGVVPLVAMVRAHQRSADSTPFRLLYAVRSPDDVFYRAELEEAQRSTAPIEVRYVYSRRTPAGWPVPAGRITRDTLAENVLPSAQNPRLFVCGSTGLVERVLGWLIELGHDTRGIRAERFGGS